MMDDNWSVRAANAAVKAAKARAGYGWTLLGPDLQHALIAHEVLMVLLAQDSSTLEANPALARLADVARMAFSQV
jgi:hypothetical protein